MKAALILDHLQRTESLLMRALEGYATRRLTSRSTRTLLGGALRRRPSSRRLAWFVSRHRELRPAVNRYDPDRAPNAKMWLALDEGERIYLVEKYHEASHIS